jgi:hypothetical protein
VHHIYNTLDPKRLYVRTYYYTKTVSKFYLPSFIGDKEGALINDAIRWCKQKNQDKISKKELSEFLMNKNVNLDNKTQKEILKEVNLAFIEKYNFT